jgi:hypothetical protein
MALVFGTATSRGDNPGDWAGQIRLNLPDGEAPQVGAQCELVGISAGIVKYEDCRKFGFHHFKEIERPESWVGEQYEFVNVLWVEWKDDVAYRKALGRVERGRWEAVEREEVDLALG